MDINTQNQITGLLQIIIGGAFSVATIYLSIYVNKLIVLAKQKALSIKDDGARELVNNALDQVDTLLQNNIISAENTLKPQIISDIADGKVDKTELTKLANTVKNNVLSQLGTQSTDVLNSNLGDLNSYVSTRLEKVLCDLKDANGTAVNKTVIPTVETTTIDSNANVVVDNSASAKIVVDNPDNTIEDGQNVVATESAIPTV